MPTAELAWVAYRVTGSISPDLFPGGALAQLAAADHTLVLEQVNQGTEGAALGVDRPLQPDDQRLQLLQGILRRSVGGDDRDLILLVRLQHGLGKLRLGGAVRH